MLILHDTDGTPLTLHSIRRGQWLRHEGRQGRELRATRMGRPRRSFAVTAPYVLAAATSQWLPAPLGSALLLAGGLLMLALVWRGAGEPTTKLPVHRGPVPDPKDRLGLAAVVASLASLAAGLFVALAAVDALAPEPRWASQAFPGWLPLAALPALALPTAMAAGLWRLRAWNRRATALAPREPETSPC